MKNSFFSINTQFENVGDALINREMIRLAALKSKVYVDFSRCPDGFSETSCGTSNHSFSKVKFGFLGICLKLIFKRCVREECYYFLSPGGYFGEVQGIGLISKWLNLGGLKSPHFFLDWYSKKVVYLTKIIRI